MMKKIESILMCLFLFCALTGSASGYVLNRDTIDFWHVFYNKTKIKQLNQFTTNSVSFQRNKIKPTDIITIKYFSDAACKNCKTSVLVKDHHNNLVLKDEGRGTFELRNINLYSLVRSKQRQFQVYFNEEHSMTSNKTVTILTITLL